MKKGIYIGAVTCIMAAAIAASAFTGSGIRAAAD